MIHKDNSIVTLFWDANICYKILDLVLKTKNSLKFKIQVIRINTHQRFSLDGKEIYNYGHITYDIEGSGKC